MNISLVAIAMFLGGGLLGYSVRAALFIIRKNSLEMSVSERIVEAKAAAQEILDEAHERADEILAEIRDIEKEKDADVRITEERMAKKELLLDARTIELDERASTLEQKMELVLEKGRDVDIILTEQQELLEELSGYSTEDAYEALLQKVSDDANEDLQVRMHKLNTHMEESLKDRAKSILLSSIQRLAVPATTEFAVSSVPAPDDIKGKIIGKEGRNIRTFERAAGVELLVDDSPGYIVVSCFDPVRRAIAVVALTTLIKDGRIQPAKIEEEVELAKQNIHEVIKEKGAAAVYECGIYTLDPRIVAILGRLHYRTSYGQNVLQHSVEMAHMAEMLAQEVGADPYIAKAGALVHDIGKALDHEFEGTHIDIGVKVLRRFGCDERIITAMKSHHDDCPHESLEAVIVQTADMISGARPGARRDSAEQYVKRLQELEAVASRFDGVEKAYALQAGREIRVFVHPEEINDYDAQNLARNIAKSIETELRYPGQIKVTIIRETRIIDYAR